MWQHLTRLSLVLVITALASGCSTVSLQPLAAGYEKLEKADKAFRDGDWETANELYGAVAEAQPRLISPHLRLGIIDYRQGRPKGAAGHFEAVLQRNPDHVVATYNLAVTHLQRARTLLDRHEQLAPVSASRPALVDVRKALERLKGEKQTPETR